MTDRQSQVPIPWYSRIAAGLLGMFILVVGLYLAWRMLARGWYVMIALGLVIACGSLVFLRAAQTGTCPRWPDEDQSLDAGPAA